MPEYENHPAIQVECYAGFRYPERPRIVVWRGERLAITTVEQQSRTPSGLVFQVRTAGGRRFVLAYDEEKEEWTGEEF